MFEKWLESFLRKKLGMFISGINKSNLHLGIFPGTVIIRRIGIKPEVFEKIGTPGKVKFSWVDKLSIHLPWNLFSEKPIVITIEDVFVLLEAISGKSEACEVLDEKAIKNKLKFVDRMIKSYLNIKIHKKKQTEITEKQRKIIDRIQVKF